MNIIGNKRKEEKSFLIIEALALYNHITLQDVLGFRDKVLAAGALQGWLL